MGFDVNEPRDARGRFTDGGTVGEHIDAHPKGAAHALRELAAAHKQGKIAFEEPGAASTPATNLFEKYGGVGTKSGADIAAEHGATEAVAAAQEKLKSATSTHLSVKAGGHVQADGSYTPERQAIHQKLLDDIFTPKAIEAALPAEGERPVMSVLGGRGGSGKSWLTGKDGPVDAAHAIVIDADHFKTQLPGYEGWNAAMFHEESSHLVDLAAARAQEAGVNVVHDATLKSFDGAATRVADYQSKGYDVHGHYMFASPATATGRAMQRFVRGGAKGRFVPPEIVMGNTRNEANFDSLTGNFAKWTVHDNDAGGGGAPKLVASGGESGADAVRVYRLGSEAGTLEHRNAGNARAVADHLVRLSGDETPSFAAGSGKTISVYHVKLHDEPGAYTPLVAGAKKVEAVGRRVETSSHGSAESYSFPGEGKGYTSKLVGRVPLADLHASLKASGYDTADDAGINATEKHLETLVTKRFGPAPRRKRA